MVKIDSLLAKLKNLTAMKRRKSNKFISIDFSEAMVEVAYMEGSANRCKIYAYELIDLQPEDKNHDEVLVNLIRSFLTKYAIVDPDVVVSVSVYESMMNKHMILPDLPERETLDAAKWQLKEQVPFELADAYLDWQVVDDHIEEEGAKKKGYVFTAGSQEIIDRYVDILKKCQLEPVRIVNSSLNYANIITYCSQEQIPPEAKIIAVLDIDYKDATISIYMNQKLYFSRKISMSWEKLTNSLMEIIVSDQGKIEFTKQEAEEIKRTVGIPANEDEVVREHIKASYIISLIRPLLEALIRELKFSFRYFISNFGAEHPSHLFLTGGGTEIKNLTEYLGREFEMKINYLPVPDCLDCKQLKNEKIKGSTQYRMLSCIGAAMSDLSGINLLPPEIKTQHSELIQKMILRVTAITLGAVLIFIIAVTQLQVKDFQTRVKNAEQHLQTIERIKVLNAKIELQEGLVKQIQKGRIPAAGLLKTVSLLIPDDIILDDMDYNQGGKSMKMTGMLSTKDPDPDGVLTDFMQELEASIFIEEATLVSSSQKGLLLKFEILCELIKE